MSHQSSITTTINKTKKTFLCSTSTTASIDNKLYLDSKHYIARYFDYIKRNIIGAEDRTEN